MPASAAERHADPAPPPPAPPPAPDAPPRDGGGEAEAGADGFARSDDPLSDISAALRAHAALPKGRAEELMNAVWKLDERDAGVTAAAAALLRDAEPLLAAADAAPPGAGAAAASAETEMLRVGVAELRRLAARGGSGGGGGSGKEQHHHPQVVVEDGDEEVEETGADNAVRAWQAATDGPPAEGPPPSAAACPAAPRDGGGGGAPGRDEVLWTTACGSRVLTELAGGDAVIWDTEGGGQVRRVDTAGAADRLARALEILDDPGFGQLPGAVRAEALQSCQAVFNALSEDEMVEHIDTVHRLVVHLRRGGAAAAG